MKNMLFFFAGLSILLLSNQSYCIGANDNQNANPSKNSSGSSINISCTQELQNLTTTLVAEYGKQKPTVKLTITDINNPSINSENSLRLITGEIAGTETSWKLLIGREIIVPVTNAKNPLWEEIRRQGISSDEFSILFSNTDKQNWKNILGDVQNAPIQYYLLDNESVKGSIANYLQTNPSFTNCIFVKSEEELISALNKDVFAIGFCNLTGIVDLKTNEIKENIKIIPIDKNMNERVDSFENIYENLSSITRGVWIGKYPDELSNNVYAISENRPSDENTVAFLTWLTTGGQLFLNSNGFCDLANIEKQSNLLALTNPEIMVVQPDKTETAGMWVIILISFLTVGFLVTALVLARRNKKSQGTDEIIKINSILDENSILAPKGLFFDRTHTWAFMEQNGTVKVGIDDFLQHITGKLTRIKMKAPGEKIRRGEKIFTINHEGKQLDIFSPVTGTIKEQNQSLTSDSSQINSSPYSEGWVYSIEPLNWLREIQLMFMADKYKEWLKDELTRLKDFFAASVRSNNMLYAQVVLQDGGELADNVLAELGPEVWEEFQRNFINTSK